MVDWLDFAVSSFAILLCQSIGIGLNIMNILIVLWLHLLLTINSSVVGLIKFISVSKEILNVPIFFGYTVFYFKIILIY